MTADTRRSERRFHEALSRIEEARRTGAVTLDLADLGLASVPASAFTLKRLQRLDLYFTRIKFRRARIEDRDPGLAQIRTDPRSIDDKFGVWSRREMSPLCLHHFRRRGFAFRSPRGQAAIENR